jgi:carboxymethylenebutenolidase
MRGGSGSFGTGPGGRRRRVRAARCPVLLHFGEQDRAIPLAGVEKLWAAHPHLPVYLYRAGHGFNCEQRAAY